MGGGGVMGLSKTEIISLINLYSSYKEELVFVRTGKFLQEQPM